MRAEYRPIEACPGLWVVPSWQAPPDTAKGTTNVILEPGLAFGTGEHPTTRLCLRWLKGSVKGGEKVMDYGCGCVGTGGCPGGRVGGWVSPGSGCRRAWRADFATQKHLLSTAEQGRTEGEAAAISLNNQRVSPRPIRLSAPPCPRVRSSGVLAVAALLLGCSRAVGVDVDPLAVKSSLANAKLNGARCI